MPPLIKWLDMPKSCLDCIFLKVKYSFFGLIGNCGLGCGSVVGYMTKNYVAQRCPNCPLVELPDGKEVNNDSSIKY